MRKVMCSVIVGSVVFVSRELFSPIWEIESALEIGVCFYTALLPWEDS